MSEVTRIDAREGVLLRVLAASALRSALVICAETVNAAEGIGFEIHWGTSGAVNKRMNDGEAFDLVAGARESIEQLAVAGLVNSDFHALGASRLAVGIKAGSRAPDISSSEKFRTVLLNARQISRGDPAGGGTAGNHLVKVFAQLDVTEALAGKSILRAGGFDVMQEVAAGRADFGLTQSTEIPAVTGVEIGAYLPSEVQLETVYGIARCRNAAEQSDRFIVFLKSTTAQDIITGAGFAPV